MQTRKHIQAETSVPKCAHMQPHIKNARRRLTQKHTNTTTDEVTALEAGIAELDKAVAEYELEAPGSGNRDDEAAHGGDEHDDGGMMMLAMKFVRVDVQVGGPVVEPGSWAGKARAA